MGRSATIITIDVEEWFHGHNYLDHVPPSTWDEQQQRVVANTETCLGMLARHGARATFFVLGWVAERYPELVRKIRDAGHEIGCHSYAHPVLHEMTAEQFRADTLRAREALTAAGVVKVAGYRAPSFSLTPPVHDFLQVLRELGFRYDSSIFPVHHPRYGQPSSPRRAFTVDGDPDGGPDHAEALTAVPMTTARLLGVNVPFSGGGYLRLLPLAAYRLLGGIARRQGQPVIVYFHPWELDTFKPDVGLDSVTRLRSQGGQDTFAKKIEAILAAGDFETLGDHVESLAP